MGRTPDNKFTVKIEIDKNPRLSKVRDVLLKADPDATLSELYVDIELHFKGDELDDLQAVVQDMYARYGESTRLDDNQKRSE